MDREKLKSWRHQRKITQKKLAEMLEVHRVTIAQWETGRRGIPSFLPLALESLEHRMQGGKYGTTGGMPGVQEAE